MCCEALVLLYGLLRARACPRAATRQLLQPRLSRATQEPSACASG